MYDPHASIGRSHAKGRRRLWLAAGIVVLAAVAAIVLRVVGSAQNARSADERLAEIEAARAIPDSENAAVIYDELLRDSKAASLLTYCPDFLEPPVFDQVLHEPWLGKDHPELATWIEEHRYIIDRLLDASRLDKCCFPISIDIMDTSFASRAASMRQWASLLSFAANNDVAEGRTDAAMAKWQCVLRMGDHLSQQPGLTDQFCATNVRGMALEQIARFVVTGKATETDLQRLRALPLPTEDHWAECSKQMRLIENLRMTKVTESFGLLSRIQFHVMSFRMKRAINASTKGLLRQSPLDGADDLYHRSIAGGRGTHILIALRRHKNATGLWPTSLNEVKAALSEEILTDPFNGGPSSTNQWQTHSRSTRKARTTSTRMATGSLKPVMTGPSGPREAEARNRNGKTPTNSRTTRHATPSQVARQSALRWPVAE